MGDAKLVARIRRKYRSLRSGLDERMRRHWAAAEARDLGWGGGSAGAEGTGAARGAIQKGPRGEPEAVRVHDFKDDELGKAIPHGVYDLLNDQGWVSVGIDHDTAEFACNSIRRWGTQMGHRRFPRATKLLITADAGGSNNPRSRLWRLCLQGLADTLGLPVTVCHFPPGTSKWNKIEHRLFSFIANNWRGQPLVSVQTIVELIASTSTRSGLVV